MELCWAPKTLSGTTQVSRQVARHAVAEVEARQAHGRVIETLLQAPQTPYGLPTKRSGGLVLQLGI